MTNKYEKLSKENKALADELYQEKKKKQQLQQLLMIKQEKQVIKEEIKQSPAVQELEKKY